MWPPATNLDIYYDQLMKLGFKLKVLQEPKFHLGGDFKIVNEPESVLTWGSSTFIKNILRKYENMFGEPVPKREIHSPLEPGDHP